MESNHILSWAPQSQAHKAYHGHSVELLQGIHRSQKNCNYATTFHGFNRPSQQVGCQGFKVLEQITQKVNHISGLFIHLLYQNNQHYPDCNVFSLYILLSKLTFSPLSSVAKVYS